MKKCNQCGMEYPDDVGFCPQDGQPLVPMAASQASAVPPLIVSPSSRLAIVGLVLGILCFVLFPIAIWVAIPTIICGHIALNRSKKQPLRYPGGGLAKAGLILGYVGIIYGIIMLGVLAKAKANVEKGQCMNNLKWIGIATRTWSEDNNGMLPTNFFDMTYELANSSILVCPSDSHHTRFRKLPWNDLGASSPDLPFSPTNITYEFLAPGAVRSNVLNVPIVRCPIDGNELYGNGSVHQSKRQKTK